jgi:hypothetical protein
MRTLRPVSGGSNWRAGRSESYAQCFWSYRPDAEMTEEKIPFVIRGQREHGGLAGYRAAAKLCR